MHQLDLVGRRHDHHAGQARQEGHVEGAGMGRAVGADQPGPVDGEADRQLLDGDVMHDLVVGALEEGRIDGGKGLEAFGRKPGGEGHRVLLGDADIEAALGKISAKRSSPVPDGIAAVMATILSSARASSIRLCANTLV